MSHNSWRRNAKAARAAALANLGLGLLEWHRHPPKRGTFHGVDWHMWDDFSVLPKEYRREAMEKLLDRWCNPASKMVEDARFQPDGRVVFVESECWFRFLDGKLELLRKT